MSSSSNLRYPVLPTYEPWAADAPRILVGRVSRSISEPFVHPHSHHHLFLIYFEQPGGWQQLGSRRWNAKAGDLFMFAPGEIHDGSASVLASKAEAWIIHFAADAVNSSGSNTSSFFDWVANPLLFPFLRSTKLEQGHFTVAAESRPVWSRRLQSLETELSQKHSGYKEAARSLLTLLLVDAARLATEISGEVSIEEQPILAKVFAFIESQYAKPISTIDVAKSLGRSSGYLTTFVRRLTGRTVLQWIIERRMAEARRLLLETDENMAVISERLSYTEPTHFIRQFRNSHRITPDAWRRANR